jgi:hypothetical protein
MTRVCLGATAASFTLVLSAACLLAGENVPTTQAVETTRSMLERTPVGADQVLPGLPKVCPPDLRGSAIAKALLESVKSKPTSMPVTTYTQYRAFKKTGDREPYQEPYFAKRALLARVVLAAWLQGGDASLDAVNDVVWNICEETNWVIPAHETMGDIDLMAAETAADLAMVELLVGPRLPAEIRTRIRTEVRRRVIDPYLDHGWRFGWNNGTNNWTGVCAGSVGQALLILEADPGRQARGLTLVVDQLGRFISRAFEEDGASTEGIGYWNYGLAHFVIFAEMFRARTDGAVDLLAGEKIRKIAGYPAALAIGRHAFASFSDSHEEGAVLPFIGARLAERTGHAELLAQAGDNPHEGRLGWILCNLIWYGDRPRQEPVFEDAILPKAGVARRVGQVAGKPVVLVAKAGNNAEQHNQNDIGSLVLRVGDTTFLCDPGAGLYDASYFSSKRYDNIFAASYGHSVPRIAGGQQKPGAQYRGTLDVAADRAMKIEFHEAYGMPELTGLLRTIRVEKSGEVTLTDEFRFSGDGHEVEEAFLTWRDVRVEGPVARVIGDDGVLEIRADAGAFSAERLEKACKANRKKGVLTRITVTYPAASTIRARFTMTHRTAG